jgi:uncharacterized membrane protein
MARTATKPKAAAARKTAKAAARKTGARPARAVKKVEEKAETNVLGKAAGRAARNIVRTALGAAAKLIRKRGRDLPIQCSVDVGVPIEVAWDEWMTFTYLPEGAHRVEDIERDGDRLSGRVNGHDWSAEIVDERVDESFAWRSLDGSDCAGLVTFHRLSERLTRVELDLDVIPVAVPEALSLGLRLADRRAEADVRRFKARVEFLDPDAYKRAPRSNGDEPEDD